MKKFLIMGVISSTLLFSCSEDDDESTPLVADFTAEVTGESPNAEITITNNSVGATTYEWTFSEGASSTSSTEEAPSDIMVDKSGNLTITLVAKNGTEEEELTQNISVAGHSAIVTYEDLSFALEAENDTYGRLFSFETEEMYKDDEIDETVGPKINLAFGSMAHTMYYFESPTVEDYNVPDATVTKVMNYEATPTISVTAFDAMEDDRLLSELSIENTEESFGNSSIPNHTVLFEISDGRKGVIKTKSVNSDRLLVDIKIQKYE